MRRIACAASLCAIFVSSSLSAQPSDLAAAEALFRAGREATARGDHATACQRFEESNRLEPAVGTVFNLANCREKLGELASAWQRYQEAVQKLPAGDERIAIASKRAAALEPRLPRLTLKLAENVPPDSIVIKDNVELGSGSLGIELPVNPGEHVLLLRAPGREDARVVVNLSESQKRTVVLEPGKPKEIEASAAAGANEPAGASLSPSFPEPSSHDSGGSGQRTVGFVVVGLGALGVAAGVATGLMAISKKKTVEENCVDKLCTQAGLDAGESGKLLSTVSTITFAAGFVGLGVGAYLVLSSNSRAGTSTTLGATPLTGGGALRLGGTFQ